MRLFLVVLLVFWLGLAESNVRDRSDLPIVITTHEAGSIAVLPNGNLVIGANRIEELDLLTGQITHSFEQDEDEPVHYEFLQVLQNGDVLAASYFGEAHIYDMQEGRVKLRIRGGGVYAYALVELANGDIAQSAQKEDMVTVFSRQTGLSKMTLRHDEASAVNSLCALPNGDLVVASATDKLIIWNIASKSVRFVLQHHIHQNGYVVLELMDDANLVSVSKEGFIVWNPYEGKELYAKEFTQQNQVYVTCVLAIANARLAVSNKNEILIVSLQDGSIQATLKSHTANAKQLQTLPDGRLVSLSDNNEINIWIV